jgi:hypothetical protein
MTDVKPLKLVAAGGGLGELREFADGDGEWWVVAPYCTVGGTANALTLSLQHGLGKPSAYRAGQQFRFRASAANTGATTINVAGLGAKTAVTVTGAALPAGYIRTDVDTTITYDAVGDRFVVGREEERGINANGGFVRYANGRLSCSSNRVDSALAISVAFAGGFRSAGLVWTYPAAFAQSPVAHSAVRALSAFGAGTTGNLTTELNYFYTAVTSQAAASREAALSADGWWYL